MRAAPSASAIVVGGGIVGSACAMNLARAGFAVTVLEANFPGCGATAAGMGHLVVMDDSPAQFQLTAHSLRLWRELFDDIGQACEVDECGTLWVAEDADQLDSAERKRQYYSAHGVSAELLDSKQLAECEPMLRPGLAGGLRVPGDAVVYPPRAAAAFLRIAMEHGAKLHRGWRVAMVDGNTVIGDLGRFAADVVVNAAGNGSTSISPEIDLRPRRGHLAITDSYPGWIRHQIVELGYLRSAHEMRERSVAFNVQPRKTGQLLIGSSREFGTTDSRVNTEILRDMLRRAVHFLPGIADLSATRVWTGIRPTTMDKLPFIGRSSGNPHVWLANGHEGLGITTSLGTASLIAALVANGKPAIDPKPFDPGRSAAGTH